MSELFFLWPAYWPFVLVVPALAALVVWQARAAERRLQQELGARWAAVAGRPRWPRLRSLADVGCLLALGVALLQPVAPGDEGDAGADVVLCVDVSWSMAARDELPSRLGAAQREVAGLLGLSAASRFAVVAYAGQALLVAPLTADLAAVRALADDLAPGAHGTAGTDPGAAIDRAVQLLQRGGGSGGIVVLSDGEDFTGGAVPAAARAAAAGFAVHTFSLGDVAGSKIVVEAGEGETFLRDAAGAEIVSRLEPGQLAAWAAAGGGRMATLQPGALRALHDDVLLPAARAAAVRAGRLQPVPLHAWPLLLALGLWMLRQCLPERVR